MKNIAKLIAAGLLLSVNTIAMANETAAQPNNDMQQAQAQAPAQQAPAQQAQVPAQSAAATAEKVDINKADAKAIAEVGIKGLTEKKAEALVKYREKHGAFKSLDDLSKVKGFSKLLKKHKADLEAKFTV